MSYNCYCQQHHKVCSPVYWRPEGRTFKRVVHLLYCPGSDNDPHLLTDDWSGRTYHLLSLDTETLKRVS